jgi:hypothetical protein
VIVEVEGSLIIRDRTAVARLATIRRYRDFDDRAGMVVWMSLKEILTGVGSK